MMSDLQRELLTIRQVAALWGVTETVVINAFDSGSINGFVLDPKAKRRTIRIYADSVRKRMNLDVVDKNEVVQSAS